MSFCTKCGANIPADAEFCGNCGSPILRNTDSRLNSSNSRTPTTTSVSQGVANSTTRRPTGVTILAILAILSGVGTLLSGIGVSLFSIATVVTNSMGRVISSPGYGAGAAIGIIFVLFILLAIVQFAVAYGFLTGASWSWWVGMIVSILSIISILGLNIIGFSLGIVMLYYLTRPRVKTWFHQS